MLKLYYSRIPEELDEEMVPFFSEYRKNKLAQITSPKLRRQSICAELLLERAVENFYKRPLPIVVGTNGKPRFEGDKLHFNISHSANWVACAVSNKEIGLDIQVISECNLAICDRYFGEDEKNYILSSENRDLAFTEIWCKKEAKLKASGVGLKGGLAEFSVLEIETELFFTCIEDVCCTVCVPGLNDFKIEQEEIKQIGRAHV